MRKNILNRSLLLLCLTAGAALLLIAATGVISSPNRPETLKGTEALALPSDVPQTSHRLIVELKSPALATSWAASRSTVGSQLSVSHPTAQSYIAQLEAEQASFINEMQTRIPELSVSTYQNELGQSVNATYQVLFNGIAVDMGQEADTEALRGQLLNMAEVKAVYFDYAYRLDTYASMQLINAPAAWNSSTVGGVENAGAGIRFASVDAGLHHEAPMFSGEGFEYPEGFPAGGLGDTQNNNGKIIASRVYFRAWDPPLAGDANSWPGENGSSHGVHTGSTAVGNVVQGEILGSGITETMSGVAPAAWAMSYKAFYPTNSDFSGSAFSIELIASIEDAVADGAHVINNSWGGGPGSIGGEFDALDTALVNAVKSGVFVAMSAGNSGPGNATTDHPSDDYINVGASTTSGSYAAGRFNVVAPEPVTDTLQGIPFGTSEFGEILELGQVYSYTYATALALEPANVEGCNPFTTADFTGKAAVISRGGCEFSTKVLNAQNAGADFAVIYNNREGDAILNMAAGAVAGDVTIGSIFISENNGNAIVDWYTTNGDLSVFEIDTNGFQFGNTPDVMASFSSRGPSTQETLKPDITAPGVNIAAQGYDSLATGEARHLGFGESSGTSMAAPHVAGAAVMLRQIYPDWTMKEVKAGLMGSAKYTDIFNGDGSPAQPLDMGSGRLDFTALISESLGVLLDPPSLSMGYVPTGTTVSRDVVVTSISEVTATYSLSSLYTGGGFTNTTSLPGFSMEPMTLTLAPGESQVVTVSFDPATSQGFGDNQGYMILDGGEFESHAAMWARVVPGEIADVLIIDADFSSELGLPNYLSYYTDALDELGLSYLTYDTLNGAGLPATIPSATNLSGFKAIIIATGDNFYPNGSFAVSTAFTALDENRLTEYANAGGIVIAMGQDLSAVFGSDGTGDGTFFYTTVLGSDWLQDSVTGFSLPVLPVNGAPDGPAVFDRSYVDLSAGVQPLTFESLSDNGAGGVMGYDSTANELTYSISVAPVSITTPVTVTAAHIHTGTVGMTGGVAIDFGVTPTVITQTTVIASGMITLTDGQEATLLNSGYYVNIHTSAFPMGEMRAQVPALSGDGASNQQYIDEIRIPPGATFDGASGFFPLMVYPDPFAIEDGIVAMMRRDQPTLERPGVTSDVRAIYTTFGLEGVNNTDASITRAQLLGTFLDMLMDDATASIVDLSDSISSSSQTTILSAELTSTVSDTVGTNYRWDFGDGSPIVDTGSQGTVNHQFADCGFYDVRVEITDSLGNITIGTTQVGVDLGCVGILFDAPQLYFPMVGSE